LNRKSGGPAGLAVLGAIALALSLAAHGCVKAESAPADVLTLVDAGPWTGVEADAWRTQALDQFTRETGVPVQVVYWTRESPLEFVIKSLERSEADVYALDVVWPGMLAEHLMDLGPHLARESKEHFPGIVDNYVVNGRLVAMPNYTDAGLLLYRTDLLQESGFSAPPSTWDELETMASAIQSRERAKGHNVWGFVWQGAAYEGLTCNALEWQASQGGGRIIEPNGTVSINNKDAVAALERAASWIGRISPPAILSFREVESERVWLSGGAAFIRDWPGTYTMSKAAGSNVAGRFDVTMLPGGHGGRAHTLGGWGLSVNARSRHPQQAIALVRFLTSRAAQRERSLTKSFPPTISSLYDDPEVLKANPLFARLKDVFLGSVARPSAVSGKSYGDVSQIYASVVHSVLTGDKTASDAVAELEGKLVKLTGLPTAKGAVDPAGLPPDTAPPPVRVEEVMADGRGVGRGVRPVLPPGVERLEFNYTDESFLPPDRVRFRYRLEGFDDHWIDAGMRRTAWYTRVPPGNYTFRVTAASESGVWGEPGASFDLTLQPWFWQTAWFRILIGLGLALFVVGGHRLRLRQMTLRQRELVALVDERTLEVRAEQGRTEMALAEAQAARVDAEAHQRAAEEANRAKSAFLAGMSHELRTPLNAILGFVQIMETRPGRDLDDQQNLSTILKSGEHLLGLIEDVLSTAKIEAGKMSLQESAFELPGLLAAVVEILGVRARARQIALRLDAQPDLPPWVRGDEGKLRQILINLLSNAIKFTAEGEVTLRASWHDGRARFEVQDTGPGITPEDRDRLFSPFVQVGNVVQRQEGTGLGLAISRGFARLMGGDLELADSGPHGSTFVCEIALQSSTAGPQRRRGRVVGAVPVARPPRVLVVDDNADNRRLLAGIHAVLGAEVREAVDGRHGVQAWEQFQPDLVWMDLRMPVMDGATAAREIRRLEQENGRPRVPIIAATASAFDHERAELLQAGCDDIVAKPFRRDAVLEKAAALLGMELRYEAPPADPAVGADGIDLARLGAMPALWLSGLQQTLGIGDVERARDMVDQLSEHDGALAAQLREMLGAYRFDELEAAVAQVTAARQEQP
jgi:trehalose/maltose transport system substrate-binding protein